MPTAISGPIEQVKITDSSRIVRDRRCTSTNRFLKKTGVEQIHTATASSGLF